MSVGFCAHLYHPESDFDANGFECWNQRSPRYCPDDQSECEEELAQDYVPSYSWLDSAVEQILARKKAFPKVSIPRPTLRLVPYKARELEEDEERDVWDSEDTEDNIARLELIEAVRLINRAKSRRMTYQEMLPYIRQMQRAAKHFDRNLKPSFGSRVLRFWPRDE